jgi:hypothetical protein
MAKVAKTIENVVTLPNGNGNGGTDPDTIVTDPPAPPPVVEEVKLPCVQWPIYGDELVEMISNWMKERHGVTGHDWQTNITNSRLRVEFQPGAKP